MEAWDQYQILYDGNCFAAKIKKKSSSLFRIHRIDILYYLNVINVNIENVIEIINEIDSLNESSVKANWILVGSGAGIYLFEELALKKYRKIDKWNNDFCTIDTDTGKTFYNLKSENNLSISKEMEYLIRNSNAYSKDALAMELSNIRQKIFFNMKY
jgi:hypothetical protein